MSPRSSHREPSPDVRQRLHTLRIQTDFSTPQSPTRASPSSPRLTIQDLSKCASTTDDIPSLAASAPIKRASAAAIEGAGAGVASPMAEVPAAAMTMRPKPHPFSLADFLYKEVFGVHDVKATDGQHQERVQNFLTVPLRTEQLFAFGVLLALDSFLYVFTYLPLRILFACGCAVTSSFATTRVFRRTHFYDLMVAVIVSVATAVLWHIDMSRVYHAIRGQAMIKLYVLFTMIEVRSVVHALQLLSF